MINSTPCQPEESQPSHFLGDTQNGNVFCSRSHYWGQSRTALLGLHMASTDHPGEVGTVVGRYPEQEPILVAKANVRGEDDALFPKCFLPSTLCLKFHPRRPSLAEVGDTEHQKVAVVGFVAQLFSHGCLLPILQCKTIIKRA